MIGWLVVVVKKLMGFNDFLIGDFTNDKNFNTNKIILGFLLMIIWAIDEESSSSRTMGKKFFLSFFFIFFSTTKKDYNYMECKP